MCADHIDNPDLDPSALLRKTCSGASSALQGPNAGFSKLMNRLLGVHADMQRKIFDYFTALQVSPAAELAPGNSHLPLPLLTPLRLICHI